MKLKSYVLNKWVEGSGETIPLRNAINGEVIAEMTTGGIDYKEVYDYARSVGNPKLRSMTFHERGRMLKALAQYLMERKDEFYPLSFQTGATKIDSWVDIEGGISTLFTYASKGRRELPDGKMWVEGKMEHLSQGGTFVGQHVCVPLTGVAVHINAYNFPVWGMLEKIAPTLIAGMPAVVKPAPVSMHLAVKVVEAIDESGILPEGALQLVCAEPGDMLDHLTYQDVLTFTGSAETGMKIKSHPSILKNNVRFNMEADSLNCSILGSDVKPEDDEFKLFVKEVVNEMTTKAGQKCTAIRRTIVPANLKKDVVEALKERLNRVKVGDPQIEGIRMGALADKTYLEKVNEKLEVMRSSLEVVYEGNPEYEGAGKDGVFISPVLFDCPNPFENKTAHEVEAFGPVNTVMTYETTEEAIKLANMGEGSLVGSLFTADDKLAEEVVLGIAPYHGRIVIINRDSAKESTGHGSPLPHMTHGGPGRAGGGEEMGGIRGLLKYMQRVALQGHPTTLTNVTGTYMPGGKYKEDKVHPFRKYFEELEVGETLITHKRTVTEADIVNFAGISGDYFYAHTDETSLESSIFERRVAHGYFVLSAAAGLFVHPAKGPVLANYGLDNLRFIQPVYVKDTIYAKLTCKHKIWKEQREPDDTPSGVVEWYVEVVNQEEEVVAVYTILTLVERKNK